MVVASGTALFAAAVLTGCGSDPDPDYQGVCVNQSTQTRVDDKECDQSRHSSGYGFLLWPIGRRIPPLGGRVQNYPGSVSTLPAGKHAAAIGGASTSGGTVSKSSAKTSVERGGFGSTSRSGWSVGG